MSWFEARGRGRERRSASACARRSARRRRGAPAPIVGFTGTGGAGKSSVVDELVRRLRRDHPQLTHRLPAGRSDAASHRRRAARRSHPHERDRTARRLRALARDAPRAPRALAGGARRGARAAGRRLRPRSSSRPPGIGQSDSEIVDLADLSVYVMTPEYGAPSQLEKIDMLDLADLVVLNKSDRHGADDALRDVRKQWRRNRTAFDAPDDAVPVFATIASRWDDPGTDRLYRGAAGAARRSARAATLRCRARRRGGGGLEAARAGVARAATSPRSPRRCAAIARAADAEAERASRCVGARPGAARGRVRARRRVAALRDAARRARSRALPRERRATISPAGPRCARATRPRRQSYEVRGRAISRREPGGDALRLEAPARRAAAPSTTGASSLRFLRRENLPGAFPFTAGVFPFKREERGADAHVRRRGHARAHEPALPPARSRPGSRAALDRLRQRDALRPRSRTNGPTSAARSATRACRSARVDDAKKLYSGFDLCDPRTSVSMTINGPAPVVLAFFLNAAIDQAVEKHLRETGQLDARARALRVAGCPRYAGDAAAGPRRARARRCSASPGDEAVDARDLRAHPRRRAAPRARHRAGRHPEGGPGPEHLHLLDRVRAAR